MSQPRMKNPASYLPDAIPMLQGLKPVIDQGGVPEATLGLVHLRVSQINGCGFCLNLDASQAANGVRTGTVDEKELLRRLTVAAWPETPYFTDAERAALALAEAVTRIGDKADPVPDDIWNAAADQFDEKQLSALILWIGIVNLYNRINITVKQPAGSWEPDGN